MNTASRVEAMRYDSLVNPTVLHMPPSGIRKFFDIVSTMKDAISLGVGEPDFVTPWNICEAAIHSLEKGETHYTSNWGTLSLRKEIARYMAHRFRVQYNPEDEVLITVGASEGIDLALRSLVQPGDEVLIPEPSYVSYAPGVLLAGGVPVSIVTRAEDEFRITPEALRAAITPRTKAFIFPYPNNPTGATMPRPYVEAVAAVLRDTDVFVISDEIYAELTYGEAVHTSFAEIEGMWPRTITLNGFSKTFAMTGWRIGFACAPAPLMKLLVKIHQYTMLCAPIMGQIAAEEALRSGYENDYAAVRKMTRSYDRRRRLMVEGFRSIGLDCFEPRGAFYVFPSVQRTGMRSEEFAEALLREEKVAVVPGTAFGASGEGFIRCCYATAEDQINEALRRMRGFMERHTIRT